MLVYWYSKCDFSSISFAEGAEVPKFKTYSFQLRNKQFRKYLLYHPMHYKPRSNVMLLTKNHLQWKELVGRNDERNVKND